MNYIKIKKLTDLQIVLVCPIFLTEETAVERVDILRNTWGIKFANALIKKLTLQDLSHFVVELIKYRTQQICMLRLSTHVTLYIWFDYQALALCFNILSGENIKLPFGCTLNFLDSYEPILNNFLTIAKDNVIHGNYLGITKIIEKGDPDWDDDDDWDPKKYVQDVWVTTLRSDTYRKKKNE